MTDLSNSFIFVGPHDSNGVPTYANDLMGIPNLATRSQIRGQMTDVANGADVAYDEFWGYIGQEGVAYQQSIQPLDDPLPAINAVDGYTWTGGSNFALIMGLVALSCGYDSMLGVEMFNSTSGATVGTGQKFILYPSTKNTLATKGPSTMIALNHLTGVSKVAGSVLNGTPGNDGRSYQYVTYTAGTAPYMTQISASMLSNCKFFMVNDGWTKWKNNQPITTDHIYYFDATSGSDPGHASAFSSYWKSDAVIFRGVLSVMYDVTLEDSHLTDGSKNRYGVVSDQDYHDLFVKIEYFGQNA